MVVLRSQNKITDFLMILAWASPFKTAFVTPLLKKDNLDVNKKKTYRSVSNIPFISKGLEKIAVKQLLEHLTTNGLLEEYQSAYRKAHSTETALLIVHNDLTRSMNNAAK